MNVLARLAAASIVLLTLAGCSPDKSGGSKDVAGAYARVIQWFVETMERPETAADVEVGDAEEPDPVVVFVEPRGEGFNIGLSMQAAIIARAEPFATVRFIDDRSEALSDEGEAEAAVRDGGVLLGLGPANEQQGGEVVIECDEFVPPDEEAAWRFEVRLVAGGDEKEWRLRGEPEPLEG